MRKNRLSILRRSPDFQASEKPVLCKAIFTSVAKFDGLALGLFISLNVNMLNGQNIWAVGRNYAEHIRELGNADAKAPPKNPMIFLKAGSCRVANHASFTLPSFSSDIHHEVEIALRFGPKLKIDAFTIALDLTARDTQNILKAASHPWTLAKSFKNSCPLGDWHLLKTEDEPSAHKELAELHFSLKVNGELRQKAQVSEMIFSMQKVCDYVRDNFPVLPGDVLLTGTPSGVAAIKPGDLLEAEITHFVKATWKVDPKNA